MPKGYHPRLTIAQRLMKHSVEEPNTGCWIWMGHRSRGGYGSVGVWNPDLWRGIPTPAHRAAFEEWVGEIPEGLQVCHRCDNPPCINPKHLFAGTPKENTADMYQKGRAKPCKGERHGLARYSIEIILAIKTAVESGENQDDIAERFGIAQSHVSRIKLGRTWRHVIGVS